MVARYEEVNMNKTKKLVVVSLLIAVQIVLARMVSIEISNTIRIGFSFFALAINAALFGPLIAGASAGIADIIGFMLKPTGPYFPGFTLTAILLGVIYGVFLHKEEIEFKNIVMASVLGGVLLLLLNSLWLNILIGKAYTKFLVLRFPAEAVMVMVKIFVLRLALPRLVYEGRKILGIRELKAF